MVKDNGNAARSAHILAVLGRHGFEVLDDAIVHRGPHDQLRAKQVREALEELGTVFVKLGQFVASQSGSLPEPYRVELAKLDDDVPPVATPIIRQAIEEALKGSIDDLFASFEDVPLGTASIGQVHAATLKEGTAVVLKVKKPGTDAQVAIDLSILEGLVGRLTPHVAFLRDMHADELMPAFKRTLNAELNYAAEAANLRFFSKHFADDTGISIPSLIENRTAGPVICETRLSGPPLMKAVAEQDDAAFHTHAAELTVWLVLEPGLITGTFHADPHAGNLLWTNDARLGVIDFGKVGHLRVSDRQQIAAMFLALRSRNAERLTAALLSLATTRGPVDRAGLLADVGGLLDRYGGVALGGIDSRSGMKDLVHLLRTYRLDAPGDVVLFFKALAMSEGLIRTITPDASFSDLLAPVLRRVVLRAVTSGDLLEHAAGWGFDAATALARLPAHADKALAIVERGDLRVWARIEELTPALSRIEAMVDRLTAAVLVAAAIIGTAVVLRAYRPPLRVSVGAVPWILLGIVLSFIVRAVGRRIGRGRG